MGLEDEDRKKQLFPHKINGYHKGSQTKQLSSPVALRLNNTKNLC